MKKPKNSLVTGNNTVTVGPCDPECMVSPANRVTGNLKSIYQANAQARMREKAGEEYCKAGGPRPPWDDTTYEIRRRYNERTVLPGASTYDKSKDGIV
jgi:hypothetical protein